MYQLTFLKPALREWKKLSPELKVQFKKKLTERLVTPRMPKAQLSSMKDCYKIKLRDSGYRLVYKVINERVVVQVIAIGKRDKSTIYDIAIDRLQAGGHLVETTE